MTREIDYRRAFKIACDLLNGAVLYGVDSDEIFKTMMDRDGVVTKYSYEEYILNHLQELDHGEYAFKALEQEPRWIPVSERLPEFEYGESDSVLVCFENETQDVLYFNGSNWCYPTGEIYISVNHKNGWHNKVVAWMPLPEPFESQESEV